MNPAGIDWASIISGGLIGAISGGVVFGLAAAFRVRETVAAVLVLCTISFMTTIGQKKFGLTLAPHIRAELHDYDAALRRNPAVSLLLDHHSELRPRLVRVMERGLRETISPVEVQLEMQKVIQEYLYWYFARTTDIAMSAYEASWRVLILNLHTTDAYACQAFLRGEEPLPVHLLLPGLLEEMQQQTAQVIRHAIHTPQPPPSAQWVEKTVAGLLGRQMIGDVLFAGLAGFTCLEYVRLHDTAQDRLGGEEYFRLVRGVIANVYRGRLPEA